MSNQQENTNTPAAAEIPQPAPTMTPEAVVERLRDLRTHIGEVSPLTTEQRKALRSRTRMSNTVLQASINAIGAVDNVSLALGQPAADVRQMHEDANRWTAVEDELRAMLNGVAGANLIRRQRVALVAAQAFNISTQLTRDPAHAALVPHVQEIKRLRSLPRRKKATPADSSSAPPAPGTPQSPSPGTSGSPKT